MTTIVVLLRAVNVAGANRIKMVDLRAAFVASGYADAVTHIQTGNVIVTTSDREVTTKERVEALIREHLGLTVCAIVRTANEMRAVTTSNPFLDSTVDTKRLYVGFLDHEPSADAVATLQTMSFGDDEFAVVGREIYLHYANGAGTTKLSNAVIERKLGVVSTARNWNVTTTLADLATTFGS